LHALARVDDGAERFVLHVDQFQRILGDIAVLCHDDGNRIANVADFGRGDRRLLRALEARDDAGAHRNGFHARHVGSREHSDDTGKS